MRHFALLAVASLILSMAPMANPAPNSGCSTADRFTSGCVSGNVNGGGVTLTGHKHAPGSGTGKSGSAGAKGKNGGSSKPTPVCTKLAELCDHFGVIPPGGKGNPGVTINDLKNFPANPGVDHMQPNGWMVVGLDTNFYSVVGVETENGTLLGQAASVRFTPISWHWIYGDGTSATRSTPGRTWAAQGIPEFDPTPTSHVYQSDGSYYIDLSITFRADYRYAGDGWTPVLGTITLPANRLKATAGDAKTVLVGRDCTENPTGPGC
jgi:hypothetical protein